jgi:hypothetical protein
MKSPSVDRHPVELRLASCRKNSDHVHRVEATLPQITSGAKAPPFVTLGSHHREALGRPLTTLQLIAKLNHLTSELKVS